MNHLRTLKTIYIYIDRRAQMPLQQEVESSRSNTRFSFSGNLPRTSAFLKEPVRTRSNKHGNTTPAQLAWWPGRVPDLGKPQSEHLRRSLVVHLTWRSTACHHTAVQYCQLNSLSISISQSLGPCVSYRLATLGLVQAVASASRHLAGNAWSHSQIHITQSGRRQVV